MTRHRRPLLARRRQPLRPPLLFALALLNWLAQPCLALQLQAPAPAMTEHCHHADAAGGAQPCRGMEASDCSPSHPVSVDSPQPPVAARATQGALEPVATAMVVPLRPAPAATGPPLIIRYCVLRN